MGSRTRSIADDGLAISGSETRMMTFPPRRCIARVTCHEDMVPKSDSVCGVCSVHDVIVAPVARGGPPKNRIRGGGRSTRARAAPAAAPPAGRPTRVRPPRSLVVVRAGPSPRGERPLYEYYNEYMHRHTAHRHRPHTHTGRGPRARGAPPRGATEIVHLTLHSRQC